MRTVCFALAAFCLTLVRADSTTKPSLVELPDATNFGLTGRIVNGSKAALRQFPHQVSLRRSFSSRHFCGGVLATSYHVITAGHCMFIERVKIQPWTILVVGGELQLNKITATGQRRGVDKYFVHPDFDLDTLQNDIAVLLLKVPFVMTPEVHAALFPTGPVVTGSICQVAGWGYPADNIPISNNDLMYVDLPIFPDDVCRVLLENVTHFPPGMFCAGYYEGGKDACRGDSGGGMICDGVLTGIVSGGEGCAHPRLPGVYSDVFFYADWLLMHLEESRFLTLSSFNSAADKATVSVVTVSLLAVLAQFRL